MAKPADFFIGIIDFFAVALPGAILSAVVVAKAPGLVESVVGEVTGGVAVAVFAVSAYVLGQVAFAAGSMLLDGPYDRWVAAQRRRKADVYYEKTKSLAASDLASDEALRTVSLHRWAEARVRLDSHVAGAEIDRTEAESKFFRTLSVVLGIAAASGFLAGDGTILVAASALAVFAVRRAFELRRKSSDTVYRYYVALHPATGRNAARVPSTTDRPAAPRT